MSDSTRDKGKRRMEELPGEEQELSSDTETQLEEMEEQGPQEALQRSRQATQAPSNGNGEGSSAAAVPNGNSNASKNSNKKLKKATSRVSNKDVKQAMQQGPSSDETPYGTLAALVDAADEKPEGTRFTGKPESALPAKFKRMTPEERAKVKLTKEDRLLLIPFAKKVRMDFTDTWTTEGYIRKAYHPLLEEKDRNGNDRFTNLENHSNIKGYHLQRAKDRNKNLLSAKGTLRERRPKQILDKRDRDGKYLHRANTELAQIEAGKLSEVMRDYLQGKGIGATVPAQEGTQITRPKTLGGTRGLVAAVAERDVQHSREQDIYRRLLKDQQLRTKKEKNRYRKLREDYLNLGQWIQDVAGYQLEDVPYRYPAEDSDGNTSDDGEDGKADESDSEEDPSEDDEAGNNGQGVEDSN